MSTIRVTKVSRLYLDDGEYAESLLEDAVRDGLLAAGRMAVGELQKSIDGSKPRPPIDTGLMRQGIGVELTGFDGSKQWAAIIGPNPATAARTAVMEKGRRPGQRRPPIDVIERWVHRKNLANRGEFRRGRAVRKRGQDKQERGIAFAIARSIARRGITARRFFARATPAIAARTAAILEDAILRKFRGRGGATVEVDVE